MERGDESVTMRWLGWANGNMYDLTTILLSGYRLLVMGIGDRKLTSASFDVMFKLHHYIKIQLVL